MMGEVSDENRQEYELFPLPGGEDAIEVECART